MKLQLIEEEIKAVTLSILCNGALSFAQQSGIDYDFDRQHYNKIKEENPTLDCYEDILYAMIADGGKIEFIDTEDDDSEYTKDLTMELLKEKLGNIENQTFADEVMVVLTESGDAENDYSVLQYILYDEIVFA